MGVWVGGEDQDWGQEFPGSVAEIMVYDWVGQSVEDLASFEDSRVVSVEMLAAVKADLPSFKQAVKAMDAERGIPREKGLSFAEAFGDLAWRALEEGVPLVVR